MSYSKQSKESAEPSAQKKSNSAVLNDSRPVAMAALQRQAQMATSAKQQALTHLMPNQQSPLQRAEDEELMQGKFATAQRAEDEELLQGKFSPVQRAEDEELMQGKFATAQRAEDEELLQGKFATAQRAEDEELLQGKFNPLQRAGVEEEDPLQGKFVASAPAQRVEQTGAKANNTGLPDQLKSGIENLSGMSMDHVKVHYNSSQPAQLNAHAYAQGSDIHVAPGQEQHLPHEAWHVVQQAQGRVKPTMQMKSGVPVNDDVGLESEADVMGAKALASGELTLQNKSIPQGGIGQILQKIEIGKTNPSALPIQRYTASEDGHYFVSENSQFAVAREAYPNSILTNGAAPMALPGGLKWINAGAEDVDDVTFTKYQADISDYEAENGPGSAKFCGQFARGLVGELPTEDQSTAEPGGVLYDRDTTPEGDDGWENHYASVVIKDGGDHATFETAVGIDHVWAGIYGSQKGQTFKYKTQQANIDRLMTIPDFVIPAEYRTRKGFWDYVFCRPGRRVKTKEQIVVPRGITMEQGEIWKNEMEAWRANGTPPESSYMKAVVQKLEAELQQLSGEE